MRLDGDALFDADLYMFLRSLGYCVPRDWITIEMLLANADGDSDG